MTKTLLLLFLVFFLSLGNAFAAPANQASPSTPPKPVLEQKEKAPDVLVPINVVGEGTDSLGARLVMRLKERFNQSNLFKLDADSERDAPMLMLMLDTSAEFSDRPSLGSVYSICWVFKQGKGYLPFLLKHSGGLVNPDNLEGLVDKLLERTDAIASRYGHLFKNKN
ncbi:MAG: hypothetical protein IJS50_00330 [Desulfovibrio sp.]|nr:hypothetical protein [Desulfovibrio sp.]